MKQNSIHWSVCALYIILQPTDINYLTANLWDRDGNRIFDNAWEDLPKWCILGATEKFIIFKKFSHLKKYQLYTRTGIIFWQSKCILFWIWDNLSSNGNPLSISVLNLQMKYQIKRRLAVSVVQSIAILTILLRADFETFISWSISFLCSMIKVLSYV